jgi:hypothetical protein
MNAIVGTIAEASAGKTVDRFNPILLLEVQ